jgi:hemoglobin/transferrin/lactoferrin receptor protein
MKTIKTIVSGLFFLCVFFAVNGQVITGLVKDAGTSKGVSYVDVQVFNSMGQESGSALTDPDGIFTISGLSKGSYKFKVTCLGYYPGSIDIDITGESQTGLVIELKPAMIPLGEVLVSSLRYEKLEKDISMPVAVIPRENFPRQSAVTLSDVLSNEPGISLVRDGGWGTSVNIRGLGESRLVTLVDGNRIETANDLVAGLSLFDVNEIERVEIFKGAASSVFGTGAMGGVVNILTKHGNYYDKPTIHGSATGVFEGVNTLFGTNVAVESGAKAWRVRLSGGYRTAGDYRTPDGIMANSGFNDRNVNAAIGVKPLKNHELEINAQQYQAFDVGIPGGAPFGPTALATYPEEKRQLISAKYTVKNLLPNMTEVSLRAYHQYILRDVELIPNTPASVVGNYRMTALRTTPRGEHNTSGMVLETRWKTGTNGQLIGGIDLWQRRLETSRQKFILQELLDPFQMVIKSMEVVKTEKPNPDSRFGSGGVFVQQDQKMLDGKLDLTFGLRADLIRVANETGLDPVGLSVDGVEKVPVPNQRITFQADTVRALSWSANVSAMYHLKSDLDITANIGRSFRSPSLEERFKYIDLGAKVRLGDPGLRPEKGLFGDLGLRIWKSRFQLQANAFVHYLNDMIVEQPGIFVYSLAAGTETGLTDTLPALVNANVDRALLTGFDASFNYQPLRNLVLYAKAAYVRGINLSAGGNLPLIPPMMVAAGLRYQLPGVFTAEWTTSWTSTQRKVATGEKETGGYFLTDVAINSSPIKVGVTSFQMFAGVDNLFNKAYRNHLATNRGLITAEPGRNLFIKLVINF